MHISNSDGTNVQNFVVLSATDIFKFADLERNNITFRVHDK
jgi:hypothetical protein